MGDVINMGGGTLIEVPVYKVLDGAKEANLRHVIVIGVDYDGAEYHASSTGQCEKMLWMVKRFEWELLKGDQE